MKAQVVDIDSCQGSSRRHQVANAHKGSRYVQLTGSASAQTLSNALGDAGALAFTVGGSVPIASTTTTGLYSGVHGLGDL